MWFAACCAGRRARRRALCVLGAVLSLPVVASDVAAQTAAPAPPAPPPGEWTLEAVVTAALSQHPLVEAARARVDAASGERLRAGAFPNPVATFWVENAGVPGQTLPVGLKRETSTYVTWPLEPFVQRSSRIRRADQDVKAAEASLTLARRQVVADAVRAFFRVALVQALVDEAAQTRDRLGRLTSYNRARVDEGVTAEAELLRLQVERDRAATELGLADVELTRSRAELAPYLGTVLSPLRGLATIRVAVPSVAAPVGSAIPSLNVVLARAREQRPELLAGRARTAAAAAAADVERRLRVPQLGATIGNRHAEGQNSMVLGVSVTVPLFDRNRGGVARATREHAAAEQDLAWVERTVGADVEGAHRSATRLARQLADLQQSFLARAEEVHRLTLGAYQEGGATLLQVLDATRMLADARLTYARALFAQRQSLFELALASGAEPGGAVDLLRAWSGSSSTSTSPQAGGAP
jgi:outer membrane protein, heavy metal efflux system